MYKQLKENTYNKIETGEGTSFHNLYLQLSWQMILSLPSWSTAREIWWPEDAYIDAKYGNCTLNSSKGIINVEIQ